MNGKTMGENCKDRAVIDPDVIRPYKKPLKDKAGFLNMKGNLFDSAIMKTSGISEEFRKRYLENPKDPNAFEGRAIVFDGPEDYHKRIDDPALKIDASCILFMRGAGPTGYPGAAEVVNMRPPNYLIKKGVSALACIGDGRQSGTSGSPSILNASPEAATGGGLAILKTGDKVRIDLNKRVRRYPHLQGGVRRAPRIPAGPRRLQVSRPPDAVAGDPARAGRRALGRNGAKARGQIPEDRQDQRHPARQSLIGRFDQPVLARSRIKSSCAICESTRRWSQPLFARLARPE